MVLTRIAAALVAALLLLAHGEARAEPLKIRVAWITVPTSLAPILFAKPELARHLGTSYTVAPSRFAGSSQMTTALAAGELEDGYPGYYSTKYMVLNDGPVKKIDELKGKVLATNVIGTGTDIGMRAMARKHGLEDKRDYTVIEANYANMNALLYDHKANLITSIKAFETPELRQKAHPLFQLRDVMGVTQILSLVARREFVDKNRAVLVDYMEDYLRSLRWYIDPANHAEAVAIAAKFTKIPAQHFEPWLLTKEDQYRAPSGRPDLEAMQHNIDVARDLGFVKAPLEVAKYADLSIVDAANKRLAAAAKGN
jgi:ABC-type nitrate/sulfonate/bicarbonate transport system substrate-binding protein